MQPLFDSDKVTVVLLSLSTISKEHQLQLIGKVHPDIGEMQARRIYEQQLLYGCDGMQSFKWYRISEAWLQ